MYENCQRLKQYQDAGKKIVVVYCGDLDPSGDCMDHDLISYFEFYELNVEFLRIAVTPKQVQQFNLPSDLDVETSKKLDRDSRLPAFIEKYGRKFAVELDAILAYEPDKLEQIVQNAVDEYWDADIYNGNCPDLEYDYVAHDEGEPEDLDPDEFRPMMIQKINSAFSTGWEKQEDWYEEADA